jgi:hypothetical protein
VKLFYHAIKNVCIKIQSSLKVCFNKNYFLFQIKLGIKYETIKLKLTKEFDKEIWSYN